MYCYDGTAFEHSLTALELDQKAVGVFHLRPYGTCICLSTKTSGSIFASTIAKEQFKLKRDVCNPHFTDDEYEFSPKKKGKVSCSKSEAFITPAMQLKIHLLAQDSTP